MAPSLRTPSHWKTSKWNFPAFLKNYIYEHVVDMNIELKYYKPPSSAKTVPIMAKRENVVDQQKRNQLYIDAII